MYLSDKFSIFFRHYSFLKDEMRKTQLMEATVYKYIKIGPLRIFLDVKRVRREEFTTDKRANLSQ